MIGKIQDMAAAAVVVSAIDKSSGTSSTTQKSSQQQASNNEDGYRGIDISAGNGVSDLDPSQQVRQIGKAATYGNEDDNEEHDSEIPGMPEIDEEFVNEMTDELNELMSKLNCDLEFQYHKEVDVMSVRMVDKETKEVIKEYPPEDMIEGMIKAREWLGAFLDKNA